MRMKTWPCNWHPKVGRKPSSRTKTLTCKIWCHLRVEIIRIQLNPMTTSWCQSIPLVLWHPLTHTPEWGAQNLFCLLLSVSIQSASLFSDACWFSPIVATSVNTVLYSNTIIFHLNIAKCSTFLLLRYTTLAGIFWEHFRNAEFQR